MSDNTQDDMLARAKWRNVQYFDFPSQPKTSEQNMIIECLLYLKRELDSEKAANAALRARVDALEKAVRGE